MTDYESEWWRRLRPQAAKVARQASWIIADDGAADADDDNIDAFAVADDNDYVYPECEDEKDRKPDDHCVQQARGLLHLFHFIQQKIYPHHSA